MGTENFYAGSAFTLANTQATQQVQTQQIAQQQALTLRNTTPFNTPNTSFTSFAFVTSASGANAVVHASNDTQPQSRGVSSLVNNSGTLAQTQNVQRPDVINQQVLNQRAMDAMQASV